MALIDYIDPVTRRIHLSIDTMNTAWHPVELYREVRALRAADLSLRKYDNFMKGDGNIDKGGGKATERYFTLLQGTRIVPWDAAHIIDITGTIITDDGFEGAFCFDKSTLTPGVAVDIQYAPKQVEVINLNFDDLVFASFLGGVWYQASSPYGDAGSDNFPNGNRERPVNSIQLATSIALDRGFDTIFLLGNVTLGLGDNVAGYSVIGQNPTKNFVNVLDSADTTGTEFQLVSLGGVLDGGAVLRECLISTLNYVNGFVVDCVMGEGVVTLGGNAQALFMRCISGVAGAGTPTIDMGGSGQTLAIRDYHGGIKIVNKNGSDAMSVDLSSGQIVFDETVTVTDNIYIRGIGRITDNSTGTATIDSVGLLSGERTVRGAGYVAVRATGYAGTEARTGTESFPVNNIADAIIIAENNAVTTIKIYDEITTAISDDLSGLTVIGDNAATASLIITAGTITTNTTFRELNINGALSSDGAIIERCQIGTISGIQNYIYQSFIYGTVTLSGNTTVAICAIAPNAVAQKAYFDFNGLASTLIISDWGAGVSVFKNMVTGSFCGASGSGGRLELDVSNAGGNVVFGGSLLLNQVNLDSVDTVIDASSAGSVSPDVNIVSVQDVAVNTIDDFKAANISVDLSTIPADVWTYATRELTVDAGLTPAQEAKIDTVITQTATIPADVWNRILP